MFLGLYLLTALSLTVLLIYRAEWGVLAAAAILPVTPSLPDTGIPAFNVTNIMICAMAVGVFARRTPRDEAGPASRNVFPAARQLAVFSIAVLWGWVNVTFIQKVPDVPTHRFNPYDALWSLKDLGTLGGDSSEATGINAAGAVVGKAQLRNGSWRTFLWQGGKMKDLTTLIDPSLGVVLFQNGV